VTDATGKSVGDGFYEALDERVGELLEGVERQRRPGEPGFLCCDRYRRA
jgi:hypothetical protein